MKRSFLFLALLAATPGCNAVLPPHSRSYDVAGEKCSIELLTHKELVQRLQELGVEKIPPSFVLELPTVTDVDAAAEREGAGRALPAAAAAIAAPLIGYAVDFVKSGLEAEAARYEASWSTTAAADFWLPSALAQVDAPGYWTYRGDPPQAVPLRPKFVMGNNPALLERKADGTLDVVDPREVEAKRTTATWVPAVRQQYSGFQITRKTARFPGKNERDAAFTAVFLLKPSASGPDVYVMPLYAKSGSAKCKVLTTSYWPWALATWFAKTSDDVGVTFDFDIDGATSKDGQGVTQRIASFQWSLGNRDLNRPEAWAPDDPEKPVAIGTFRPPLTMSSFTIKAVCNERDPSNAKQWIEKGAQAVGDNRQKLIDAVLKWLEERDKPRP
jgi:hypothetical protein